MMLLELKLKELSCSFPHDSSFLYSSTENYCNDVISPSIYLSACYNFSTLFTIAIKTKSGMIT